MNATERSITTVTIVTPSFNQGRFLRAAVESVLAQDYPHVEYLVVDGGSSDESVDILKSYGSRVRWISEPDRGQADAINKGIRLTSGAVVGWLNSDDVLAPGAVSEAVRAFTSRPDAALVYGRGSILDGEGRDVGPFREIEPFSLWRLLYVLDYILQPAAFFRRDAALAAGLLDERLEFALDWDFWIRLASAHDVVFLDRHLAFSRVYGETKTGTGGWRRIRELGALTRSHTGLFWTPGVQLYALDTLARQLARWPGLRRAGEILERRLSSRIVERLPLHADGWLGPRGRLAAPRHWAAATLLLEIHRLPASGLTVVVSADGHELARTSIGHPGLLELDLPLPPGHRDFVELEVTSSFSFRTPPDRRRLSVRLLELRPRRERQE